MLSDSLIRNAKPADQSRKFADSRGLYLLLLPNGGRYWRFDYRFDAKRKTLALGAYPDVSLAKARARHQEARERLADGIDPCAEKQTTCRSFESVARDWYAYWKTGRNERHTLYVLRRLEADVFPQLLESHSCFICARLLRLRRKSVRLAPWRAGQRRCRRP